MMLKTRQVFNSGFSPKMCWIMFCPGSSCLFIIWGDIIYIRIVNSNTAATSPVFPSPGGSNKTNFTVLTHQIRLIKVYIWQHGRELKALIDRKHRNYKSGQLSGNCTSLKGSLLPARLLFYKIVACFLWDQKNRRFDFPLTLTMEIIFSEN